MLDYLFLFIYDWQLKFFSGRIVKRLPKQVLVWFVGRDASSRLVILLFFIKLHGQLSHALNILLNINSTFLALGLLSYHLRLSHSGSIVTTSLSSRYTSFLNQHLLCFIYRRQRSLASWVDWVQIKIRKQLETLLRGLVKSLVTVCISKHFPIFVSFGHHSCIELFKWVLIFI